MQISGVLAFSWTISYPLLFPSVVSSVFFLFEGVHSLHSLILSPWHFTCAFSVWALFLEKIQNNFVVSCSLNIATVIFTVFGDTEAAFDLGNCFRISIIHIRKQKQNAIYLHLGEKRNNPQKTPKLNQTNLLLLLQMQLLRTSFRGL